MMTVDIKQLEAEIASVSDLARAEVAFAAVGEGQPNPWEGAGARLRELEQWLAHERLCAEGNRLVDAIAELQNIDAQIESDAVENAQAQAALTAIEAHPTILRWRRARVIAMNSGFGGGFEGYAKWIVSGRPSYSRGPLECPAVEWPKDVLFDDPDDRKVILALGAAQNRVELASAANAHYRRTALLADVPELRAAVLTTPKSVETKRPVPAHQ